MSDLESINTDDEETRLSSIPLRTIVKGGTCVTHREKEFLGMNNWVF